MFIAGFAAATQGLYGNVHVLDAILVGVPAIAGVLLGTWLQQRVPQRSISLLFAARARGERGGAGAAVIGAIAIGVLAGVLAGMLGVGGGVVFVPGLVILLGLDQHAAEATSLLAIIPVAIVGTIRQDRYGNVRRADALTLGTAVAGRRGGRRGAGQRALGQRSCRTRSRPSW